MTSTMIVSEDKLQSLSKSVDQNEAKNLRHLRVLNELAVMLYKEGAAAEACKTLTMALSIAHTYLTHTNAEQLENSKHQFSSQSYRSCYSNSDDECFPTERKEYSVYPDKSHSSVQEIYSGAFVLSYDSNTGQTETITVLLFNLALIHHQTALRNNRMYKLAKALQIYKKAVRLAQESHCARLKVLIAAAFVNMIQILMMVGIPATISEASSVLIHLKSSVNLFLYSPLRDIIAPKDLEFFAIERFFAEMYMSNYRCAPTA